MGQFRGNIRGWSKGRCRAGGASLRLIIVAGRPVVDCRASYHGARSRAVGAVGGALARLCVLGTARMGEHNRDQRARL